MNRRNFLKKAGMIAGAAMLGANVVAGPLKIEKPVKKTNFVFILIDDMGWPDLGCYGHTFHETPNIDKLASEGMRFTSAYAACPVCSPTRASIYSGQYPAHLGLTDFIPGHWRPYEMLTVPTNDPQYLPNEAVTVAEAMKSGGYTTGAFGKWHCGFGSEHTPGVNGFDDWVVMHGPHYNFRTIPDIGVKKEENFADVVTYKGLQFLEQNRSKPFMLFVNHFAVHIPLQAEKTLIEKYKNKPKPETGVNNPTYAAMVEYVDSSVQRILEKIDELGLRDNTVVVLFSDNGGLHQMYTGEGAIVSTNAPLRDEKGTVYEGGIRVPMIVRWPGHIQPGRVCDEPVTSVDFYPTFIDIAGVRKDRNYDLDGESLVPLLTGKGRFDREAIFWHYPVYHHSVPAGAVRAGDWKLIEFYDDHHVELYNLKDDIGETQNLAPKMPHKAKEMMGLLADWRRSVGAKMPVKNPNWDPKRASQWGVHPDRDREVRKIGR